jgi:TRAP-type C4-dicarboxylate transport system substrate-binding protein
MRYVRPFVSLALAYSFHAAAGAQTTWQLATGYTADLFQTRNVQQFAHDVAEATNGRLKIDVRPDNALVRLADIPDAVASGRVAAGEVIMTGLVKQVPIAGADAVPFIVRSYDDARRLWQSQRPLIEHELQARGLVALYAVPWPSQGLFTTRPVQSTADLRGARMRTYNATTVRIAQLMGATPVDVPMAGVAQALAAGRIDSMITSAITGVDNHVWDQLKYFYDIKAWFPKNIVLVNRARFEALTDTERDAVRHAADEAERRGWAMSEATATASVHELAAHGMHIESPGFEFASELRRLGDHFSIEWVHACGRDASAILIPYYTAGAERGPLVVQ